MTIYLVRHGETALNAARVLQPEDTPLSLTGQAQARALTDRFKMLPIGALLCSDLPRARQTAAGLRALRPQLSYLESDLLRERNLGEFRGQPYSVLNARLSHYEPAPPGGESLQQFNTRVALAFEQITQLARTYPHLVVVSHGLVLRQLLETHFLLPQDEKKVSSLDNTSVSLALAYPPYAVTQVNCTKHLSAQTVVDRGSAFGG
jgi:2,3-bisphosphoglycerate-dependent phosphoglycerate mutase